MYEVTVHTWDKRTYHYTALSDKALETIVAREKAHDDVAAIFASRPGKKSRKLYQGKKKGK